MDAPSSDDSIASKAGDNPDSGKEKPEQTNKGASAFENATSNPFGYSPRPATASTAWSAGWSAGATIPSSGDEAKEEHSTVKNYQTRPFGLYPYSGRIYTIHQRSGSKVIAVVEGQLRLVHMEEVYGGTHWRCEESDGWTYLRNTVSGTYIGCQMMGAGNLAASVEPSKDNGRLVIKPAYGGGLQILIQFRQLSSLYSFRESQSGNLVVDKHIKHGLWRFSEVPYARA